MIIVVASRHDTAARRLATRWAAHGATLLTTEDLAAPGWRWSFGEGVSSGTVGLDSVSVSDHQITGVVTRLPHVFEHELPFIADADRGYVAQEMNAFLLGWLTSLSCPVLNRPTPISLLGVGWRPQQWRLAARRAGFEVAPQVPRTRSFTSESPWDVGRRVLVVGDRVVDSPDDALCNSARSLARDAGVELLSIDLVFVDQQWRFLSADPSFDPDIPANADAVLEHLQ